MKYIFLIAFLISFSWAKSQTVIKMKSEGGVYVIPSKVNGLGLNFIFDTGASNVSLSLTEVSFMLKNGYLKEEDFTGEAKFIDANGYLREGLTVILKKIEIGGLVLRNVKATIVKNLEAPLLLGLSALRPLGKIQIDYGTNTITIMPGNSKENNSDTTISSTAISDSLKPNRQTKILDDGYYFKTAEKEYENDNYEEAVSYLDTAISINKNCPEYFLKRAYAKQMANYESDALVDYEKYLTQNPKDASAYANRGVLRFSLKDTLGAIKDLQLSIQHNPKYSYAYRELARINILKKLYSPAINLLNSSIKYEPENCNSFLLRGYSKYYLKKYLNARLDFDTALKHCPDDAFTLAMRGGAKIEMKEYSSAKEDIEKAIEIDSSLSIAYRHRANLYKLNDQIEEAIIFYKKTIELDSTDVISAIELYFLEEELKNRVWISVASTSDQEWFIKKEIESKYNDIISIWIKQKKKKYTKTVNGRTVTYSNVSSLQLVQVDCNYKKLKSDYKIVYDSNQKVIFSEQTDYSDWEIVPPGSIGEEIIKTICQRFL